MTISLSTRFHCQCRSEFERPVEHPVIGGPGRASPRFDRSRCHLAGQPTMTVMAPILATSGDPGRPAGSASGHGRYDDARSTRLDQ